MPAYTEVAKPTVHIHCTEQVSLVTLTQILYGMEEEGIPYEVTRGATGSALDLAFQAASASRLEVGIGADGDSVVLHYAKLPPNEPLFRISSNAPYEEVRALGSNGGRLVKKLPLKSLHGR